MKRFITSIFIALIITAILVVFEIGELFIIAAAIETIGLGWTAFATCVLVFIIVAAIIAVAMRLFGRRRWYRRPRRNRNR